MICGLLGRKLGHSYSPRIHRFLGNYAYHLFEKEPGELESFLLQENWHGLNVTIPYKKDAVRFCSRLSEAARTIQSVNTLVRLPDGSIFGDNTDAFGFACLLDSNGINPSGEKALILGNGGACASVRYVLEKRNAHVVVISRTGTDNYENLDRHKDAALIVNTTPVGMYPNNGAQAVDLGLFPHLEAVLDLIYNPARTAIMLQAESLGIRTDNGLYMLAAQAYASSVQFMRHLKEKVDTGLSQINCENPAGTSSQTTVPDKTPDELIASIYSQLYDEMQNIILVGMPGSGKSSISKELARLTGREVLEMDEWFEQLFSISPAQCILKNGEEVFRKMESEAIAEAGKQSGKIISTGGGCVTVPANYPLLHQNGRIVWIRRDLSRLPVEGRPLSQRHGVENLYQIRRPLYEKFADLIIDNDTTPEDAAKKILERL